MKKNFKVELEISFDTSGYRCATPRDEADALGYYLLRKIKSYAEDVKVNRIKIIHSDE